MIDGGPLTPDDVVALAYRRSRPILAPSVQERMAAARRVVEEAVAGDEIVYGITTGFGALSTTRVEPEEAAELQVNLLRSHAAGVGPPVPDELVRAMLALRARTLAQGHSGVRTEIVARLVEMLDQDLLPVVPSQGSVGASGDLAPFAHLALPVIGEGFLKVEGQSRAGGRCARGKEVASAPAPSEGGTLPSQRHRRDAGDGSLGTGPGQAILRLRPTSPVVSRSRPCSARPGHSGPTSTLCAPIPVRSNLPVESPA